MQKYKPHFLCSLMIALSLGCGFSTEKRRPKALEDRLEQRSVKKISEAEILNVAERLGDSIAQSAQAELMSQLIEKIGDGHYAKAVDFCSTNAQKITDSIGHSFGVNLKRVSLKNRNPLNQPSSLEMNLLEAYAYSAEQGQKPTSNLQFYESGDSILYSKPIFIPSALCLNCHGREDKINELTKLKLAESYPQDSAHGYELGDFRAMWSVKMAKKQVVSNIYN